METSRIPTDHTDVYENISAVKIFYHRQFEFKFKFKFSAVQAEVHCKPYDSKQTYNNMLFNSRENNAGAMTCATKPD